MLKILMLCVCVFRPILIKLLLFRPIFSIRLLCLTDTYFINRIHVLIYTINILLAVVCLSIAVNGNS